MRPIEPGRRLFLQTMGGVAGATWLNAQLPFIAAAAQHAHEAVQAGHPAHFDVLTPAEATEVSAISARIIPTDDQPGATEAGAVYFIDRALKTFASEYQPIYKAGLVQINLDISKMFPAMKLFSAATVEQQDQLLAEISKAQKPMTRVRRDVIGTTSDFFPIILTHTMMGFLAAPEAGGNFDYVGWKVIGRDPDHTFSPPFGYYDKNYPGWQPPPHPKRRRNDRAKSELQDLRRSGFCHHRLWRGRWRSGQGTINQRIQGGGSRARPLPYRE